MFGILTDPSSVLEEFFKVLWCWWVNVATLHPISLKFFLIISDVWICLLDLACWGDFLRLSVIPEGSPVAVWDS